MLVIHITTGNPLKKLDEELCKIFVMYTRFFVSRCIVFELEV